MAGRKVKTGETAGPEKIGRLAQALNAIYRRMDLYTDELQISPKELSFLLHIEDGGPLRVKDLATRVNLPLSTVSWTADRMVTRGHLKRRPDPRDRRAVILELARKGRGALAKHHETFAVLAAAAHAQLAPKEFDQILGLIEALSKVL